MQGSNEARPPRFGSGESPGYAKIYTLSRGPSQYITISLFMYEDEKIRAAGELCRGKEGIGATLLRSL